MIHTPKGVAAVDGRLRQIVRAAYDLGVTAEIRLSGLRLVGEVIEFDVVLEESNTRNEHERVCQAPGCGLTFIASRPDALYHTDNCRLKAFRAKQRAEAQALIDALNEAIARTS